MWLVLGHGGFVGRVAVAALGDLPHARGSLREHTPTELVHIHAPTGVIWCIGSTSGTPEELHSANVGRVQEWIKATTPDLPVIALGSCAEYGRPTRLPVDESHLTHPISNYGRSKLEGTRLWLERGAAMVLRPSNIVGPGQPEHMLLGSVLRQVRDGADPVKVSRLSSTRDYVHVADIGTALRLATEFFQPGAYNLGRGQETSNGELLDVVRCVTGQNFASEETAPQVDFEDRWSVSAEKFSRATGWRPGRTLEDAVREAWACA